MTRSHAIMNLKDAFGSIWLALGVFLGIALALYYPNLIYLQRWGAGDWDQHFLYNAVPYETIRSFHQLPLWNPYLCGGNVLLAQPESVWLSPFFILVLIFGPVVGLKIQIIVHLVLGMFGMFLLSRHYRLNVYASYLPPLVFMLSSWFVMHIYVGHSLYLTLAYLPFVFWFYLKSISKIKFALAGGLALAVVILGGGTYPFAFLIMFLATFAFFNALKVRSLKPIKSLVLILIFTVSLAAVKLLPTLDFLKENIYSLQGVQPVSIKTLYDGLLGNQKSLYRSKSFESTAQDPVRWYQDGRLQEKTFSKKATWGWHEYSAYIGVIPFLLFCAALIFLFKRDWDLIVVSSVFLLLYLGDNTILFYIVKKLPVFKSLHGSSRFVIIFIFCIALLSGKMFSFLENKFSARYFRYVGAGVLLIVLCDLFLASYPYAWHTFLRTPVKPVASKQFHHVHAKNNFYEQYPNFLGNKGTLNCYDRLKLPYAASPKFFSDSEPNPDYRGEAYLLNDGGDAQIKFFSPNKIIVKLNAFKKDKLIINQNYDDGWKVKRKKAVSHQGLIAVEISSQDTEVVLHYLPTSFIAGAMVSCLSMFFALIFYFKKS